MLLRSLYGCTLVTAALAVKSRIREVKIDLSCPPADCARGV
jgi:hypothetical protein